MTVYWPLYATGRLRCVVCGGQILPINHDLDRYSMYCPRHPRADIVFLSQEEADNMPIPDDEPEQGELFGARTGVK